MAFTGHVQSGRALRRPRSRAVRLRTRREPASLVAGDLRPVLGHGHVRFDPCRSALDLDRDHRRRPSGPAAGRHRTGGGVRREVHCRRSAAARRRDRASGRGGGALQRPCRGVGARVRDLSGRHRWHCGGRYPARSARGRSESP